MRTSVLVVWLTLLAPPATASQTACIFTGETASDYYELEFIGYDDIDPMIVFSSTAYGSGKRVTLHPADYSLKRFNQHAAAIDLEFRNPGNHALPASFVLVGKKSRVKLRIGPTVVGGVLACGS